MRFSKKLIGLVVCIVLSLSTTVFAFAEPNSDSKQNTNSTEITQNNETVVSISDEAGTAETVIPVIDSIYSDIGLRVCFVNAAGTADYINVQISNSKNMIYLPSNANLKAMVFEFNALSALFINSGENAIQIMSNEPIDITPYLKKASGDGTRELSVSAVVNGEFKDYSLFFIQSANIASMYIKSADPTNKGLLYVAEVKGNKGSGAVDMINADGSVVYSGTLSQIKGRGNSTWAALKKPFQIKLKNSCDLIETGDPNNKSKTWVLLANAFDSTLIHNQIAFDMASSIGLLSPDNRPVDLYYDGQYLGSYLLCEKVEEGNGRVPIDSKGYLLELDDMYGNQEENYVVDANGTTFVVKAPEKMSEDSMTALKTYLDEIALAASNGGINPVTGSYLWDLVDIDSLAKLYVLEEMTGDPDAFVSSIYFYIPENGKLTAGPVWDFDSSFGVRKDIGADNTRRLTQNREWIGYFLAIPEFAKAVRNVEFSQMNAKVSALLNSGISKMVEQISASQRMDELLWSEYNIGIYYESDSYKSDINYLKNYLRNRNSWLYSNIGR